MIPMNTPIDTNMGEQAVAKASQYADALGKNTTKHKHAQYVKSAKDFEGFMIGQMFKSMYSAVEKSEILGDGKQMEMFMNLYIDEASKVMAEHPQKGGIAEMMIRQYEQRFGKGDESVTKAGKEDGSLWERMTPIVEKLSEFKRRIGAMVSNFADRISSAYGERIHPVTGEERMHHGVDIALPMGTDVRAPLPGRVIFAGPKGGYGNFVAVDHGHGLVTQYAHLSEITVNNGDSVTGMTLIGKVGSTGVSTGPHLHFEVLQDGKTVNPQRFAAAE